jgi:hypothetical protein
VPLELLARTMTAKDIDELKESKPAFQRTLQMLRSSEQVMRVIDLSDRKKDLGCDGTAVKVLSLLGLVLILSWL